VDEDKKFSYFFLGLGIGVAVGMLFAPKAGDETREYLSSKLNEGTDYVKRRSSELRETASEWVDRGKQTLRSQRDQLNAAVEAGKQAYREAVQQPGQPARPMREEDAIEGV